MRCLRVACALVLGLVLLSMCAAAAETDPIVGEWRGEGSMLIMRAQIDANGRWGMDLEPGQKPRQRWHRENDHYVLEGEKGENDLRGTLSPDGQLTIESVDDLSQLDPSEREAAEKMTPEERAKLLKRFTLKMRKVGEQLGSLAQDKAARAALTASDVVGRWEWVWSRTSLVPSPPNFHEMLLTESGDMIATNSLLVVAGTGTYRIENGQLYMQPQGGAPVPPINIGFEGDLLVMGMGDGDQTWPAEHLYARVGEGHVAVPAELVGTWRQAELTEGVLLTLTFLARGHYTLAQQSPGEEKPQLVVHDRFFVRFWQSPHGPAFTRVVNIPDMGGPVAVMALWKRDGEDLLLTDMRWDASNSKLEVATEPARYRRVSE